MTGSAEHTSVVHIPRMEGESIPWLSLFGFGVSNTVFTTWLFILVLIPVIFLFRYSLATGRFPRIKYSGLLLVEKLEAFSHDLFEDRAFTRKSFFFLSGLFLIILFGNIFGLILDWLNLVMAPGTTTIYFRPINSDLNTTIVMAVATILFAQILAIHHRGFLGHVRSYIFNFTGSDIAEKCVNVFVGWLHFIGEFVKVLSLSFRLFGNIFAGIVLIAVITFLSGKLQVFDVRFGEILVLPFWFFELFVAFIQAFVFFLLTSTYLKEARSHEH